MRSFVPVSKLQDSGLIWQLVLPSSIDLDRIGVDEARVDTLRKVGRVASITIIGYEGDVTQFSFGTSEINPDGTSAITSALTTQRAELSGSEVHLAEDEKRHEFIEPDATIKINTSEMLDRVRAADQAAGYTADWHNLYAKLVDNALRREIPLVAKNHLLAPIQFRNEQWWCATGLFALQSVLTGIDPGDLIRNFLFSHTNFANTVSPIVGHLQKKLFPSLFSETDRFRRSLFDGYQIDRVAAVYGLAKASRLVRALP